MKPIVPQDLRIKIVYNYKILVRDFISKQPNLSIKKYAEGDVISVSFENYYDFVKGIGRLRQGENLVHIGKGENNMSLIIYKK